MRLNPPDPNTEPIPEHINPKPSQANAHMLMHAGIQRMQHDLRRLAWDVFIRTLKVLNSEP